MKTILNALFENNLNFTIALLVVFLFIIETIYLYDRGIKNEITSRGAMIVTAISVLFASMVLISSDAAKDSDRIKIHDTGCILDMFEGHDYLYPAMYLHYFEKKELYICDDVDTKLDVAAHMMQYDKTLPVVVGGGEYTSSAIASKMNEIDLNTLGLKKDGRRFILDKTWKKTGKIICVQNDDGQVFFVSEQLYLDAISDNCEKDYLSEKDMDKGPMEYMDQQRGEGIFSQLIVLLGFFLLGWLAVQLSAAGKNEWLSFFMSFPVGISIAGTVGTVFFILGIPFRKVTISLAFLSLIALEILLIFKKKIRFQKKGILMQGACAIALNLLVSYLMIYSRQGDSFYKTGYGIFLAEFLPSRTEILSYMDFGLLEPIIHAIGWKFHADFVYGMYIMASICAVGMLISAMVYLFKINENKNLMILTLICIMILVTNFDYIGISVWVLTNGTAACLYLLILLSAVLAIRGQMNPGIVIATAALSCMIARVEGTCYICLILVVLCGIKEYRDRYWGLSIIVGAEAIIWQVFQLVYSEMDSPFWSPDKAYMLIAGGVVIMVMPFVMKIRGKLFDWIRKNYYKLFVLSFALISLILVLGGAEKGYSTARVFMRHLTVADSSNSVAIWGFCLLMLPLLLAHKKKISRMLVAYVLLYLLLTYCIFTFRTDDTIHEMYYDSCRRVVTQLMPSAMFAVMYVYCSIFSDITKEKL